MRHRPSSPFLRAAVAPLCCILATAAPGHALGGEEPGPVPLLRDAVPAARQVDAPRAAPGGLADWRLVAALGATFVVLVGARLASTRRAPVPPPDVFEILGTASLGGQHAVRIVRFGPKTLLVGVSAAGTSTLAEIGDPQATACIAAACRGVQSPARHRPAPAPPSASRPAPAEAA